MGQLRHGCCFVHCWQHAPNEDSGAPVLRASLTQADNCNPTLAGAAAARLAPGALLRFNLQLAVSRGESGGPAAVASVRAIFLGGARGADAFATGVSGVAGVAVPSLPFFAAAPVRCRPLRSLAVPVQARCASQTNAAGSIFGLWSKSSEGQSMLCMSPCACVQRTASHMLSIEHCMRAPVCVSG